MKRLCIALLILIALSIPVTAFAHTQTVQPTTFYACEASVSTLSVKAGDIDVNSITQDDTLDCSTNTLYPSRVQWSVTGPKGDTGAAGTNGIDGAVGATGPVGPTGATGATGLTGPAGKDGKNGTSGMNFLQPACTETGLTGSAQQENLLFCVSGVEPDGGAVYLAAIAAAKARIIVGTPVAEIASVDWSGVAIKYVSFTSGLHAEYHADNVVRIYNTLNQRVA